MKLSYRRAGGELVDLAIRADPGATVGAIAEALAERDPTARPGHRPGALTLAEVGVAGDRALAADMRFDACGLRSGATVSLLPASDYHPDPQLHRELAVLHVTDGPDAGLTVPLRWGSTVIGRDPSCDVVLTDPLVSKRHARIDVGAIVEIVDLNSSNGVLVGGGPVSRARLGVDDSAVLGDDRLSVVSHGMLSGTELGAVVEFNRSPRLDPVYPGVEHEAPSPPRKPSRRRFPFIAMLVPLLTGVVLYLLTGSVFALVFVALSPLMVVGSYAEDARSNRRAYRAEVAEYRAALAALNAALHAASELERASRRAEHPSTMELIGAAHRRSPLLWTRRPEHASFLELRLGLGRQPSRDTVKLPARSDAPLALYRELTDLSTRYATIDEVPAVARLRECGALGLAETSRTRAVAWGIVAQLVALHSPAELVVTAVTSETSAPLWDWLKWLPHTSSFAHMPRPPVTCAQLTTGGAATIELVGQLDELIERRSGDAPESLPVVVLLVEDDAKADRRRLVDIAERGPAAGVHVVWVAPSIERLPAACRTFLEVDGERVVAGFVRDGTAVEPVAVERVIRDAVVALARSMAPLSDAGARVDAALELPRSVSFLELAGTPVDRSVEAVLDRWALSGSLPGRTPSGGAADRRLHALVGSAGSQVPFHLDLLAQGPHALVGGTTGAGKSELLQSWILGMATQYSPSRVTFLLVDYKGGAAFGACAMLPHAVGLVTDLSPHEVHRALDSLHAEVRSREWYLKLHNKKDLGELADEPGVPPRLVIVVDEFAALRKDVPEFVDGVVDVAQRGRSLGLHLILATQRPAGVITDNLRANTNLRIALRMADEADSTDVLGSPVAASFDAALPGRAVAKVGPGRLVTFQTAYAGGWTTGEPPEPKIEIATLPFGPGTVWPQADVPDESTRSGLDADDITRVARTVRAAASAAGLARPKRPWLEPLPEYLELADLLARGTPERPEIVLGRCDVPSDQAQPVVTVDPAAGNMVAYGTGGTGKSTLLRTAALSFLYADPTGIRVYGIEFGAPGLSMLARLPQVVVVRGEDEERLGRLLDDLLTTIDRRASGEPYRGRILVLLDGAGAFHQAYPSGVGVGPAEKLQRIATDGRAFGVHLAVTADRPGAVPSALSSALQRRIILRQAGDQDYATLGVHASALPPEAPAGRCLYGGRQTQVAVYGGTDPAAQETAVDRLAQDWRAVPPSAPVRVLEREIPLAALPVDLGGPVFAVSKAALQPVALPTTGPFVLSGPDGSGRTTALRTIAAAFRRWRPGAPRYAFAPARGASVLAVPGWTHLADGLDEVKALAEKLTTDLAALASGGLIVIESTPELIVGEAEQALYTLVKALGRSGPLVVFEGEVGAMASGTRLHQLAKVRRSGLILQPQQMHGTQLFQVDFPRLRAADFPIGRGMYVRQGQPMVVQVALPDAADPEVRPMSSTGREQ